MLRICGSPYASRLTPDLRDPTTRALPTMYLSTWVPGEPRSASHTLTPHPGARLVGADGAGVMWPPMVGDP